LVEGLAQKNSVDCFSTLSQGSESEVMEAIVQGTHHSSARVRSQCARLLGMRQDIWGVKHLQPLLVDPDESVRRQAARAMIPLLDDEELLELLRSPDCPQVAKAKLAQAMLRDSAELTVEPFVDWILQPAHPAAMRVHLYNSVREGHSPCYGKAIREKPLLAEVQASRRRILSQVQKDALNPQEDLEVRAAALPLYAQLAGPDSYAAILALARSSQTPYRLRDSALISMGLCAHPEALERLAEVAHNDHLPSSLRFSALSGLQQVQKEPKAVDVIVPLLQHSDARMRSRAARALRQIGDKRAIDPLKKAVAAELDDETSWQLRINLEGLEGKGQCLPCPPP
jgi:HEAT repeat protein